MVAFLHMVCRFPVPVSPLFRNVPAFAVVFAVQAQGATVYLRDSIRGFDPNGLSGMPNFTQTSSFAVTPIQIAVSEPVTLLQFRGIGFGVGPLGNRTGPPVFSAWSVELQVWRTPAEVISSPHAGTLINVLIPNTDITYTQFGYNTGNPNINGGIYTSYEMKIQLAPRGIDLLSGSYVLGFEVHGNLDGTGDWNWSLSPEALPTDYFYYGGSPTESIAVSSAYPGSTGRVANELIATTVPEPGAGLLLAGGIVGMLGGRRIRRVAA